MAPAIAAIVAVIAACSEDRASSGPAAPTWRADVAPIASARCAECHGANAPAAGWRATSYIDAIGCVAQGSAAVLPNDARAPIVAALDEGVHAGRLAPNERATLAAWVAGGAPAFAGIVHSPQFADPRAEGFHGKFLRDARWRPMLDPLADDACGRCHEGAPARPAGVTSSAPGATACTACHTAPKGPLDCATCHGNGARIYPPRDGCFFPNDKGGAHAAHVEGTNVRAPLECSTCHLVPPDGVIGGSHGNGSVDVVFDTAIVGPEANFDRTSGACTVTCHDQGGARARPAWAEAGPMKCGDCHGAPPQKHYPGTCSTCHKEANADGTALAGKVLHMNGKVDVGDGSGTCSACHGKNGSPWPDTGAHAAHKDPTLTVPVDCASCHPVPNDIHDAGHMNGKVDLKFGGRAADRGVTPSYDGTSCTNVACHGAGLRDVPQVVPAWKDTTGAPAQCGACHGIPPTQHTASTSCDRSTCHGTEVSRGLGTLGISAAGKSVHINGVIDTQ